MQTNWWALSEHQHIRTNLLLVQAAIAQAEAHAGRPRGSVRLLAVSKTKSISEIRTALDARQCDFGENYLQEALTKIEQLKDEKIRWHFIGSIQSNKARDIAHHFDWVHSIEKISIAQRIARLRPQTLPPLNVCLQVNIDQERSKSGCSISQVHALADQVEQLQQLELRGLMAIPKPTSDTQHQYETFVELHTLFEQMKPRYKNFDTLSAGMSGDFEQAIKAGSTLIRIGTAIFGPRE